MGGIKTRWLFADALAIGKEYFGELAGTGYHGKIPYVVWIGAVEDGVVAEYQVSTWRIESDLPFDADKHGQFSIKAHGKNIFFRPL